MDCIIRKAEQEDRAALVDCVQAAYSKYIERIGTKPAPMLADYRALIAQNVVYVLTDAQELQGVLVMMPRNREMFVENIAIDPRFQGRGLGRRLIAFVEQQAREAQLEEISLYTNEMMTENLQFYQRLGFEEEGRYAQGGYCRVLLRKSLR